MSGQPVHHLVFSYSVRAVLLVSPAAATGAKGHLLGNPVVPTCTAGLHWPEEA